MDRSAERDQGSTRAAEATFEAAEAHFARGEYGAAFEHYAQLLRERTRTAAGQGFAALDAVLLERLADLAVLFGRYTAAEDLLVPLIDVFASARNIVGADYARLKLAAVFLADARLIDCRRQLEAMGGARLDLEQLGPPAAALAARESTWWSAAAPDDRRALLAGLYLVAGRLLAAVGQYASAAAVFDRGLALTGADAPDLARRCRPALRLAAAQAALERGDFERTDRMLSASSDEVFTHQAEDLDRLETEGRLAWLRGDLGAARRAFGSIRDRCAAWGLAGAHVRATVNLAHVLILLNQTAVARGLLEDASAQAASIGDVNAATRADALREVAVARAQSLADAVAISPSITELWLGPSPRPAPVEHPAPRTDGGTATSLLGRFDDRVLVFHSRLGARDFESAAAVLRDLDDGFAHSDSMLITARLVALQGMLAYYNRDAGAAEAALAQAAGVFEMLGVRPDLWQTGRFLAWTHRAAGQVAEAERWTERSAVVLEEMTRTLDPADGAIFHLNKWTAEEEALGLEVNRLAAAAAATRWWARPVARLRARTRLMTMLSHVDTHQRALARRALATDPSRDPARPPFWWRTSSRSATIGFLVLPDRLLAVCWHGWSGRFAVRPVTRIAMRELVAVWHRVLEAAGPASAIADAGAEIAAALGLDELLESLPARVEHLRIVADDSLRGIPFAALPFRGGSLVERFSVAASFDWFPSPSARRAGHSALVAGVSTGPAGYEPLAFVLEELNRVEEALREQGFDTTILDDADKASVVQRIASCSRLHLACHGVFEPDAPDQSGLVLSRDGQPDRLTLSELAGCDLQHLDVAVLSACWAADNFILPGRYVISLPFAIWRAGARAVIAPLWQIEDRAGPPMLTRLYAELADAPPAEALQRVQLAAISGDLRTAGGGRMDHPSQWAALQAFVAATR